MTLLHEAVDLKKMDTRMIERNVARGVISQDDVEKALKKLPDDAENAEYIEIDSLIDTESMNGSAIISH